MDKALTDGMETELGSQHESSNHVSKKIRIQSQKQYLLLGHLLTVINMHPKVISTAKVELPQHHRRNPYCTIRFNLIEAQAEISSEDIERMRRES